MNAIEQARVIEQIHESVACGLIAAFASMTNEQIKELVFSAYRELNEQVYSEA